MDSQYLQNMFFLKDKTIAITGGGGVLCSAIAQGLAKLGARVAILDLSIEGAHRVADLINSEGGKAIAVQCNVLEKPSIEAAAEKVIEAYGRVDILINGAGGNKPQATTNAERSFFDLPADAIQWVFNLNILGTYLPTQVFGKYMVQQGEGNIVNISSMNSFRPLTRVSAYSAAKAGVSNFTQWLAVHMAQEYSVNIRVNAIAPGFFLTDQNRFLLTVEGSGALTSRGKSIIDHTPMARFGEPDDLVGTVIWLLSPASRFVTGTIIPIDGGFSAFSGV